MESRKGIDRARRLRTASTDTERLLWTHLRGRRLGCKFRRQYPISGYIVDFVCLESRLIIELDGGQHAERAGQDAVRTAVLEKSGFRVLRFWNDEVLRRVDDVLERILHQTDAPPSPQPLSRQRERG